MENLFPADISRRVFVKGIGFVSVGLVLGTMGGCEELAEEIKHRPIRRRLRTGSAAVDKDIATYKHAVELMKALPASDPRSWTAQAGVHGTVAGGFLYCQHGTDHFFDWHRAYLVYFERICQKLTGKKKFGLPYWNWNQNPDINPAFLDPASALFLARTRTSMTGSWSITSAALDPILADTNFFTFRPQIEGTPHNTVHGYIGGTMGTGGSALDPVFWTHHCMVDYCWAKWNIELGNNNTNDPGWINTVNSHFVDADGNPATVTAGLTTIMPLISYQYESSAIGSSPATAPIKTKKDFKKLEKRIKEGADIRFDIKQRIRIMERATVSIAKPLSIQTRLSASNFANIINSDVATERVFLNIDFAQLPPTSDFAVRVFINLPGADSRTPATDPHFAGSFAFFGTPEEGTTSASGGEHKQRPDFIVNITDTLRTLKRNEALTDTTPLSVQLVAVAFAGSFERPDTTLLLEKIDVITTPVIVNSRQ
jgi:tyrosinase